jgi:hypothetical protein
LERCVNPGTSGEKRLISQKMQHPEAKNTFFKAIDGGAEFMELFPLNIKNFNPKKLYYFKNILIFSLTVSTQNNLVPSL